MQFGAEIEDYRTPDHSIDELFVRRWSPRAMSGEGITQSELDALLEAARWAPSSYNAQPWRFIYTHREDEEWEKFYDLMVEFNQQWAKKAAVLIVVVSRTTFEWNDKPAPTHSFDAGAAWQNLALQATRNNLVAHGMQGFDYERARDVLRLPDGYSVEAMIAIGRPGRKQDLPEEMQKREKPSDRKPLSEIAFRGGFKE